MANADSLVTAEKFIDAFYSFDSKRLSAVLHPGNEADNALYYQAWAQAAHYEIKERNPCSLIEGGSIQCAITVTDDFGTTLGYTATDTFTLVADDKMVSSVTFEGDDPLIFYVLYLYISIFKSEVMSGPCEGMFEGGDTPAQCASAVAGAAQEFMDLFSW